MNFRPGSLVKAHLQTRRWALQFRWNSRRPLCEHACLLPMSQCLLLSPISLMVAVHGRIPLAAILFFAASPSMLAALCSACAEPCHASFMHEPSGARGERESEIDIVSADAICANANGFWNERQPQNEPQRHDGQPLRRQPHDATPEFSGHEWDAGGRIRV